MTADEVEDLARRWCKADGHDPDWMVVDDRALIPMVATPFGAMKSVTHIISKPLWHTYANGIMKLSKIGVVVSIPDNINRGDLS